MSVSVTEHEALGVLIKAVTDYQWNRDEVLELKPAWEAAIEVYVDIEAKTERGFHLLKLYPVKGQCDDKDCYRRAQQVLVAANGLFWYCNQHAETAISEVVG